MKCLLVLDNKEVCMNENVYKDLFDKKFDEVEIIYTRYENGFIRKIRRIKIIGNFLTHFIRFAISLLYALKIYIKRSDVIISFNPIVGIFLGLLNLKKRKIIISGFLFEPKSSLYYHIRIFITNKALNRIDKVICYSKNEVALYNNLFIKNRKFVFRHYGSNFCREAKYTNKSLPTEYIFSGGGSNRDYDTLIKGYTLSKQVIPLLIATQAWKINLKDTNFIILDDVVNETFSFVLLNSKGLILSLKDSNISAGHMVMLQAMKLGIPIIINDIPSVRDYVNEEHVEFFQSKNIEQLAALIDSYFSSDIAKIRVRKSMKYYYENFTFDKLVERVANL